MQAIPLKCLICCRFRTPSNGRPVHILCLRIDPSILQPIRSKHGLPANHKDWHTKPFARGRDVLNIQIIVARFIRHQHHNQLLILIHHRPISLKCFCHRLKRIFDTGGVHPELVHCGGNLCVVSSWVLHQVELIAKTNHRMTHRLRLCAILPPFRTLLRIWLHNIRTCINF